MKWAGLCQILQPHNSPSKSYCPAPRTEMRVLMSLGPIKFWQLCAPHVGRRDGNPTVGISPVFTGTKNHAVTLIRGYKYPFELIYHFTFTSKSSRAYTLNLVKCPVELTPSFSIKSLREELFLTSVSFLFSLTYTSSFLSLFLSYHFLSFTLL